MSYFPFNFVATENLTGTPLMSKKSNHLLLTQFTTVGTEDKCRTETPGRCPSHQVKTGDRPVVKGKQIVSTPTTSYLLH